MWHYTASRRHIIIKLIVTRRGVGRQKSGQLFHLFHLPCFVENQSLYNAIALTRKLILRCLTKMLEILLNYFNFSQIMYCSLPPMLSTIQQLVAPHNMETL